PGFIGISWFVKMKNARAGGTESSVSESKVRIELYRFRIQVFRAIEVLEQGIGAFLDRNSTQIQRPGIRVLGWLAFNPRLFIWGQRRAQGLCDFRRQLTLKPKRIIQITIVTIRP